MILAFFATSFLFQTANLENPGRQYPNLSGASGVYRSTSAEPNVSSTFGVALTGAFFQQEPFINNKKQSRSRLRLSGNYNFDLGTFPLETFASFGFTFNENSTATGSRTTTTYFEDLTLGLRLPHYLIEEYLSMAVFGSVHFLSGTQSTRNSSGGSAHKSGPPVGAILGLAFSSNWLRDFPLFPMRHTFNLAYRSPNGDLKAGDSNTEFNRFSTDAYRYHALLASYAFELTYQWVKPFAEYSIEKNINSESDGVSFKQNRQNLAMGARVTPFEALNFMAGVDFGFAGPSASAAVGIPRNPKWELIGSIAFQGVGNRLSAREGNLRGAVLDAKTGMPLAGATATLIGETGVPFKTGITGTYEFYALPNGAYSVKIEKENYESAIKSFQVEDGKDVVVDVNLSLAGPKMGSVEISVVDKETRAPISRATLSSNALSSSLIADSSGVLKIPQIVEGSQNFHIEADGYDATDLNLEIAPEKTNSATAELSRAASKVGKCVGQVKNIDTTPLTAVISSPNNAFEPFGTNPETGAFEKELPQGTYELKVYAENYLPTSITCEAKPGETNNLVVTLEKPKTAMLVEDKIVLPDAIYFKFASDEIKKESLKILDQVAEILLNPKTKYETLHVDGHTDSTGSDEANFKLSDRRARAVVKYLVKKGVASKKLTAKGFGKSKPVATNTTKEGRAENRRVEFNLKTTP